MPTPKCQTWFKRLLNSLDNTFPPSSLSLFFSILISKQIYIFFPVQPFCPDLDEYTALYVFWEQSSVRKIFKKNQCLSCSSLKLLRFEDWRKIGFRMSRIDLIVGSMQSHFGACHDKSLLCSLCNCAMIQAHREPPIPLSPHVVAGGALVETGLSRQVFDTHRNH